MGNAGSPYREASAPCGLCGTHVATDEAEEVALLAVCPRCVGGDLEASLRHWGFEEKHRSWVEPKTPESSENRNLTAEVTRATELDLHATLCEETVTDKVKRFFGRGDPTMGEKSFDDLVRVDVEPDFEPTLALLLEGDGARAAIEDLVRMGCTVTFGNQTISSDIRNWVLRELPDIEQVLLTTMVLAVHVERFAKKG